MTGAGFEPAIPATKPPLGLADSGTWPEKLHFSIKSVLTEPRKYTDHTQCTVPFSHNAVTADFTRCTSDEYVPFYTLHCFLNRVNKRIHTFTTKILVEISGSQGD
jgi:hypothetical protein